MNRARTGWMPALVLVGGVTLARLLYLALLCPYALIEDEAHYWEWTRHLDWSYYSKGPGVAWAIWASTQVWGDTEFGVRFLAPVFGAAAALGVAGLAGDAFRDPRARLIGAALALLTPTLQFPTIIMTIDGPMLACWALACWAFWRGVDRGNAAAWISGGLALGAGFLFKYTILLLVPGVLAFLVLTRSRVKATHLVLASVFAALGLVPVLVWNAQHDWATVRHLLGHLGVVGGDLPPEELEQHDPYTPMRTLEFAALALVGMGFPMLLAVYSAVAARGSGSEIRRGVLYCLCCAAPVLLFYLVVTFFSDAQPNWHIGAYITLLALGAWGASDALRADAFHRRAAWRLSIVAGVIVGVAMLRLDLVVRLPGLQKVPIGRLTSAPGIARDVDELRDRLRDETGLEPFVISEHYGRASLMAFYLPDRPVVYCSSSLMSGRSNQYDLWESVSLDDPALLGRPAVLLRSREGEWAGIFDRQERIGRLENDHKRGRPVYLGYGYRGFAP